jgi:hypothetical protein
MGSISKVVFSQQDFGLLLFIHFPLQVVQDTEDNCLQRKDCHRSNPIQIFLTKCGCAGMHGPISSVNF